MFSGGYNLYVAVLNALVSRCTRMSLFAAGLFVGLLSLVVGQANAQVTSFGGNAQHTSLYSTHAAQHINSIHWQASIDFNNEAGFTHYGAPLVTAANTVLVPQKTNVDGFQVSAFSGADGTFKYTLDSDWVMPSHGWIPTYQPVIATGAFGTRLYYSGAGGTVLHVDNPDSNTPGAPVREPFYTSLSNYNANASAFNGTIFIDTPLTADSSGNIYFGFRVENGTAPAPINSVHSGFARISSTGQGSYVLVDAATGDSSFMHDSHNAAPALSADETTVYVVCKATNAYSGAYLLGLDTTTLSTKFKVALKDPRNGNNAGVLDDSTASPMVAPDGDVYIGTMANPDNGSRGFLLRFNSDLSVEKTPGAFGWDFTPAIVPASMVPSYTGSSTYLIFSKYNNYANVGDGNGINRIALLDPNATQTDFHPTANGLVEMREVMTVIGMTPDTENPGTLGAIREWCINTAAVDPNTKTIFTPSEDGHIYRWDLTTNSLTEALTLGPGIGEPYIPTVIGPDGTVYTLNGGNIFALGDSAGASVNLTSSVPSVQTVVAGDSITYTATVTKTTGSGPVPTGTVTFADTTYVAFTPTTTTSTVAVDGSGVATYTVSAEAGTDLGGDYGNHFITATYNGDGNYPSVSSMRIQKVHAFPTSVSLASSGNATPGSPVTLTATVNPIPPLSGIPTGQVTFLKGTKVLAQVPCDSNGVASFTTTKLPVGNYDVTATYYSDYLYAASLGDTWLEIGSATTIVGSSSPNPSLFGQTVTLNAHVTSPNGTPTGTVYFTWGNWVLGTAPVNGSGVATCQVENLAARSYDIVANFSGDPGWQSCESRTFVQVVNGTGTTTKLSVSPNPAQLGNLITFKATVKGEVGTPTGVVAFMEGDTVVSSAPVVNGVAQVGFNLPMGTHTIVAAFTGDQGWTPSSSSPVDVVVVNHTTISTTVTPGPIDYGQTVTYTTQVTSVLGGIPTGNVVYKDGATTVGSSVVDGSGQASFQTSSLSVGNHVIAAYFTGTNGWVDSWGKASNVLVRDGSTTSLTSNPNPSTLKQGVRFTATVTPTINGAVPKGKVVFSEGAKTLVSVRVDDSCQAGVTISNLSVGTHTLKGTFVGDPGWGGSNGTTSQTVNSGAGGGGDVTPPSVPTNVSANSGPGLKQIQLTWSASTDSGSGVAGYEVWRSVNGSNGTFTLVSLSNSTSFVDTLSSRRKTAYYYVVARDNAGNRSGRSLTVAALSN